jgi:hypothetical protein
MVKNTRDVVTYILVPGIIIGSIYTMGRSKNNRKRDQQSGKAREEERLMDIDALKEKLQETHEFTKKAETLSPSTSYKDALVESKTNDEPEKQTLHVNTPQSFQDVKDDTDKEDGEPDVNKPYLPFSKDGRLVGTLKYGPKVVNVNKKETPEYISSRSQDFVFPGKTTKKFEEGYCIIC